MHIFYVLLLSLFLVGCGGEPEQIIADMEASGDLPVLDRTDSVAGIDSDNNGVRDDIDNYINKTYTVSAQKSAAIQSAKVTQNSMLVDKFNKTEVEKVALEELRASNCAFYSFGSDRAGVGTMRREIRSLTTNTKIRLLSYLEFSKAMSGAALTLPKGNTCE